MKKSVWLSFDLGVKGDYTSLFEWLDSQGAEECGPGLAYFQFDVKEDFLAEIEAEIKEVVQIDSRSRIYIIFRGQENRIKGRFIIGGRKAAPWSGFAQSNGGVDEDA